MLIKLHVKCLSTRQEACVEVGGVDIGSPIYSQIDDVQPGSVLKSKVEQQFQVNVTQQKLMKGGRAIAGRRACVRARTASHTPRCDDTAQSRDWQQRPTDAHSGQRCRASRHWPAVGTDNERYVAHRAARIPPTTLYTRLMYNDYSQTRSGL
jgi:hypothetical protein